MERRTMMSTSLMTLIVAMMIVTSVMPVALKSGQVAASSSGNGIEYTNHAPIRINSDGEFAALAASDPNVNGTGSALDPFTIEDLNITGASAGTALYIGNVSLNFIIRNSSFILASGNGNEYFWNSGIVLHNAIHGTVEYNKVYSNTNHGICVDLSSRLTLKWNQIYSNTGNGIDLFTSTEITMANNTIHHNANGIHVVNGLFDDFSTTSRYWSYYGSAYRNSGTEYLVLTNSGSQVGVIWLKPQVFVPMSMSFQFYIGGGDGADGMVAMFNKNRNYNPVPGSALGFTETYYDAVPGYGVEFDEYPHSDWDPTTNPHIGLIDGIANNYLYWADESRIGNGVQHTAKIEVWDSMGRLALDNTPPTYVMPATIDRTYGGLGFSGATGGQWNNHFMDDIDLQFNETNLIRDNVIHNNSAGGIELHKANHDIVLNNTVQYNDVGIELLEGSTKVNVVKNNVSRSNHEGILISGSNNNTLKDNNVSYNNQDAGQQWNHAGLKFANSENNSMEHNYVSHNPYYGVHFESSKYDTILNNQIVFNCGGNAGLYISSSQHERVEWNNVSKGTGIGIYLYDSHLNYIANNTVNDNAQSGVYLDASSYNTFENSTFLRNGREGFEVYGGNYNIIRYNNISYNSARGIFLQQVNHDMLLNNTVSYNDVGIGLYSASFEVSIAKNNVSRSNHEGILINNGNNNTLKDNNVSYNNQDAPNQWNHAGIKFLNSENNSMEHNYVSHNPYYGVHFDYSKYDRILNNQIVFNCGGEAGLYISSSLYERAEWNNVSRGTGNGIYLSSTAHHNLLTNNTVNDNAHAGAFLDSSSNHNTFENSTFLRNGWNGIEIYGGDSNILRYNNISVNTQNAVYLWGTTKNRIHHNLFMNNGVITQAFDNTAGNFWNASDKGNYWSNYDTPGEGCNDGNSNGICDAAYVIPGGVAFDYYPITTPLVPGTIDASLVMLALTLISFAFVAVRRRR